MGYISVCVSRPACLSVKNSQLIIKGEEERSFPLEDINVLMIENAQCTITTYALKAFADNGILVYTCDDRHLPNGVLLPFNSHSRQSQMLSYQIETGKALKKQLWQAIVKKKNIQSGRVP